MPPFPLIYSPQMTWNSITIRMMHDASLNFPQISKSTHNNHNLPKPKEKEPWDVREVKQIFLKCAVNWVV